MNLAELFERVRESASRMKKKFAAAVDSVEDRWEAPQPKPAAKPAPKGRTPAHLKGRAKKINGKGK